MGMFCYSKVVGCISFLPLPSRCTIFTTAPCSRTPTQSLTLGAIPSPSPTVAPLYYLQTTTYESCQTTCGNLGLNCQVNTPPASQLEMQALAAAVNKTCATFNAGWTRPMISGTACYYGTSAIACDVGACQLLDVGSC